MNNTLLQLKIKQRMNSLSSNDYDSIECWMIVEAFNKVQNVFVREEARRSGQDTQNLDDLQAVVKVQELIGENKARFYEAPLPKDYFAGLRVSAMGVTEDCPNGRPMVIYDADEGNLEMLLRDINRKPSFEWAESFQTMGSGKIRLHTDGLFELTEVKVTYYCKPRPISFATCVNEFDQPTPDVESIFKDDVTEMLIDRTASLLSGDIERFNQMQRLAAPTPQQAPQKQ